MSAYPMQQQPACVAAAMPDFREVDEHMKLIRKLRWVGLGDEAKQLQEALRTAAGENRREVLADTVNTD